METQNILNVGEKLKGLRASKSMSLRLLSQKSGVSANALSLIERNKTSPTVTTLVAIAKAFNMQVHDFFSSQDQEAKDFVICRSVGTATRHAHRGPRPKSKAAESAPGVSAACT